MITDNTNRNIGKLMGRCTTKGVRGFKLNPFNGLGGDVFTSLDNETKTNRRTNKCTKLRRVGENTVLIKARCTIRGLREHSLIIRA